MLFLGFIGFLLQLSFNSLYELLGVQENCTEMDVELAFINRMDQFLAQPNEHEYVLCYYAYKILSNKTFRFYYDLTDKTELFKPANSLISFILRLFHRKPLIPYKPLDNDDLDIIPLSSIHSNDSDYLFYFNPPNNDPKTSETIHLFRNLRNLYSDIFEFARVSTPEDTSSFFSPSTMDNQLCFIGNYNGNRQAFGLFSDTIEGIENEITSILNIPVYTIRKFQKLISWINKNSKSKKKSIVIFDKQRRLDLHILFKLINIPKSIPIAFFNNDLSLAISHFNLTELPAVLIEDGNGKSSIIYQDEFQFLPQYASTRFFNFTEASLYDDCNTDCFVYIGNVTQSLIDKFRDYHYKSIGVISNTSLFAQKNKLHSNSWIYVESPFRRITKIDHNDIFQFNEDTIDQLHSKVKYAINPSDLERISKWNSLLLKLKKVKKVGFDYFTNITTTSVFLHFSLILLVYFIMV